MHRFQQLYALWKEEGHSSFDAVMTARDTIWAEIRGGEANLSSAEGFPDPSGGPPASLVITATPTDPSIRRAGWDAPMSAAMGRMHDSLVERLATPVKVYARINFVDSDGTVFPGRHTKPRIMPTIAGLYEDISRFVAAHRDGDVQYERNIQGIASIEVHTSLWRPFGDGSGWVELPSKLRNKKAVVNVKNKDDRCFLYAVASVLHPTGVNENNPYTYTKYLKDFKVEDFMFPFSVSDVSRFVRVNEEPMGGRDVDVYETKAVPGDCNAFTIPVPLRVSRERFNETGELLEPVRLLLFKDHYVGIRPDTWKCLGGGTCFQRIFSSRGEACRAPRTPSAPRVQGSRPTAGDHEPGGQLRLLQGSASRTAPLTHRPLC